MGRGIGDAGVIFRRTIIRASIQSIMFFERKKKGKNWNKFPLYVQKMKEREVRIDSEV